MYAYATKYQEEGRKCERIFLIYPATESTEKIDTSYCFKGVSSQVKEVPLNIVFFDLSSDPFLGLKMICTRESSELEV